MEEREICVPCVLLFISQVGHVWPSDDGCYVYECKDNQIVTRTHPDAAPECENVTTLPTRSMHLFSRALFL